MRVPALDELHGARTKKVGKVVYGYYPHWAQDLTTIRFEDLTHLAWFAVEMDAAGDATALHGWPDATTVEAAHAAGVRVDLSFTLFSGEGIRTLVTDPARRANAITTMIDLMEEGDADGIAVDFEGFVDGTREGFVTFVAELRDEMDARGFTEAEISLAGPAVDWGDEWDVSALLDSADTFFIMGYDYFWAGSANAGPVGILRLSPEYVGKASWTALRSVTRYASLVGPEKRRRIIYGVPYYGREWTTTSSAIAAPTIDTIGSVTFSAAMGDLSAGMVRQWDDGMKSPFYAFQSGGSWHQVYYDDAESLTHKYRLALDQGLGGVGIWALNYDAPHADLWDTLEAELPIVLPAVPEGHREAPIRIAEFPFHHEGDTTQGPSQYFNFYSCDPELAEYGREYVYAVDVCQPGTLSARIPEVAGVDPDLHLLSDLREDACVARAHNDLETMLEPGRHYLTVDTYVQNGLELEGAFVLDVTFEPDPATEACAAHLECQAGVCACPDGETECDGACVDTMGDADHCGGCGVACDAGESCDAGICGPGGEGGSDAGGGAQGGGASEDDDGGIEATCTCRAAGREESSSPAIGGFALIALLGLGRSIRRVQRRGSFGCPRAPGHDRLGRA